MVQPMRLSNGREISTWGVPVKMNEELASRPQRVPALDEHRNEILAELDRLTARSQDA